jgi:hypothetical protein
MKMIDDLSLYDLDDDGMADITIITRNGERGVFISLRALLVLATTATVWFTSVIGL